MAERKMACKRGHVFTAETTYISTDKLRRCKICRASRLREFDERRRHGDCECLPCEKRRARDALWHFFYDRDKKHQIPRAWRPPERNTSRDASGRYARKEAA